QIAANPPPPAATAFFRPWFPAIITAYLLGTGLFTLRLILGFFRLHRLRKSATPISIDPILSSLCKRLCTSRSVQFLQTVAVDVPTVLGFFRPIILLPVTALSGLSADQLAA